MARTLGSLGANIVVLDLSESAMEKLSKELSEKKYQTHCFKNQRTRKRTIIKSKRRNDIEFW